MLNYLKRQFRLTQTKFSFGATSAIISNLGLITGLQTLDHAKLSIVGGIIIIGIADNIADSFGIHMFQESECLKTKEVWISTLTNFLTRVSVSFSFIPLILFLSIKLAVISSVIWGLVLLSLLSYSIARREGRNPQWVIFEHIIIAVVVIFASSLAGKWFTKTFAF
jgi:VIT1/CCC1 family predicted Fe2+/Mn2+ transporter